MDSQSSHNQLVEFDIKAKANGFRFLFGVDEVGRGPLAGPVVSAAVCLRTADFDSRIDDSKALTPRQRRKAFDEIFERAWVGIGCMSEVVIDEVNILQAAYLSMTAAVRDLVAHLPLDYTRSADFVSSVKVLVDGNSYQGSLPFKVEPVVKGDALSLSIACASVVAKVYRDRWMDNFDRLYPGYGFKAHKGYPTAAHREAISRLGRSPIHRKSFRVI